MHAIDCYLNGNQDKPETYSRYMMINDYFQHRFLSKNSPEIIIETCIVSLTITSYLVPKRLDVVHALNQMLVNNLDLLLQNAPMIVQARMALFFGYFSDILFKNESDKFKQTLQFLFESIGYGEDKIVIGYQACETLTTLIADKNLIERIKPLVDDIINIIIKYIQTTELSMFFDFLGDFMFIHRHTISGRVVEIIHELALRTQIEQEAMQAQGEKTNHIINQCWNVMRSICESDAYIPEFLDQIEQEMKPIFEYATTPDKIDFDDDITLLVATSIKLSKRLTAVQKTIFQCYEPMHSKYDGIFGNLLQCLNMYIVYNEGWLAENPTYIQSIHNMATKSLNYAKKNTYNVPTN